MDTIIDRGPNPLTRQTDTGRLSRKGKQLVVIFIAIGLVTLFLPIIKYDPPVRGQQYWSLLDQTLQLQASLHPQTPVVLLFYVPFGLVYLTLLVALAAALLLPFRKVLLWISLVGLFLLSPFRGLFGVMRLAAFVESGKKGGGLTPVWLILAIAMLAVAIVA